MILAFHGIGKKKAFQAMYIDAEEIANLSKLGSRPYLCPGANLDCIEFFRSVVWREQLHVPEL